MRNITLASLCLAALTLTVASRHAAAQDYESVETAAADQRADETAKQAADRWEKAFADLETIGSGSPPDFRYCYLKFQLEVKLGRDLDETEKTRSSCTLPLLEGTRSDGKKTEEAGRAKKINVMVARQVERAVAAAKKAGSTRRTSRPTNAYARYATRCPARRTPSRR